MKIYDISQELFSSVVFPGDIPPTYDRVRDFSKGDVYSLTNLSLCAHNGTHIDAPRHFIDGGKTVDVLELERFVGKCCVVTVDGVVTAEKLSGKLPENAERVCIRGGGFLTEDAAELIVSRNIRLVGVECQSVSDPDSPVKGHTILLSSEVGVLEGIRLGDVPDGEYFLFAAPINLGGAEGAPCRALLLEM